jgi:cytochrome b involved in lipid metabolism
MSKTFTPADVATHNKPDTGLYIIVDSNVYDVTSANDPDPYAVSARLTSRTAFVDEHPGGSKILKRVAGKDASKQFWKYHNESVLKKYGSKLQIGTVKDAAKL